MSYTIPGSQFEWIDQTANTSTAVDEKTYPLFMTAISADKGPEDMRIVSGDKFFKLYGKEISFAKHGQPLLQAQAIINEGGTLLVKRVVADDATLSNLAILAKVKTVQVQKTDVNGVLVYTDSVTGSETTVAAGNTPIMIDICSISYESKSVVGAKDINTVFTTIAAELDIAGPTEFIYPLFILTDNGRGKGGKKFRITPDYFNSKALSYVRYVINIIENNGILETIPFSADFNVIEDGLNMSIESSINRSSLQVKSKLYDDNFDLFLAKVAELSGNTVAELKAADPIFGMNKKGTTKLPKVEVDNSFNLSYIYGLNLDNGSNGAFGDYPFGTAAYFDQVVSFFNGDFSADIYDLDNYKIDCIIDANYSAEVKRAIEAFATFREDAEYFRDLGTGLTTSDDIMNAHKTATKNKFCYTTHLSYDIIDPNTKKQITVTANYTLAKKLVTHFASGRTRPFAGELNNMVLEDAIEGTVNFIPKITPSYNQKEILVDDRINYACYYDNKLVMDTMYTSQVENTELSYVSNVLAIQEVIKAVRTECPKIRYSFLNGNDLLKYKQEVDKVINRYVNNFEKAELVYLEDTTMASKKVFYAAIKFEFKDFVQAEYFKLYTL